MPRRRLSAKGRRVAGRPRLSDAVELFLYGDDAYLGNDSLMRDLIAEKFFIDTVYQPMQFTEYERRRFEALETRYREWRLAYDTGCYGECAKAADVLEEFTTLMSNAEFKDNPKKAFMQAKLRSANQTT